MKRTLGVALLLGLLVACGDEDKTANLVLTLGNVMMKPAGGGYSYLEGGGSTLTETGGVGVQLTTMTLSFGSATESQPCRGRINAHGTVSLGQVCSGSGGSNLIYTGQYYYYGIPIATLSVTVEGIDDNGHRVLASAYSTLYATDPPIVN